MFEDNLCGCGKAVRYSTADGRGACNKYQRCLSYEEQGELIAKLIPKSRIFELTLMKIVEQGEEAFECKAWAKVALDKIACK